MKLKDKTRKIESVDLGKVAIGGVIRQTSFDIMPSRYPACTISQHDGVRTEMVVLAGRTADKLLRALGDWRGYKMVKETK